MIVWDMQVIDVENKSLQNVIEFPPAGAFIVQSDISVSSDQRIDFDFTGASLKLPKRTIQFPPVGKGWCVSRSRPFHSAPRCKFLIPGCANSRDDRNASCRVQTRRALAEINTIEIERLPGDP